MTALLLSVSLLGGCGQKEELSVEDEVQRNLEQMGEEAEDKTNSDSDSDLDDSGKKDNDDAEAAEKDSEDNTDESDNAVVTGPTDKKENTEGESVYVSENPFLGYTGTSTSYDIHFKIQTDSGIAGIVWGVDPKEDDCEYYLWSFDLTREFPRLYTCRRNKDTAWDETYTNLDIMYPEMNMFTGGEHIVEISVADTKVSTYLDSVLVFETELKEAAPIGRIGTWVMEGDYCAYFDDLNIREGADGSGDYLYVEDFSKKASILPSKKGSENGRYKAVAGLTLIPAAK